jgi:hypothetical protein
MIPLRPVFVRAQTVFGEWKGDLPLRDPADRVAPGSFAAPGPAVLSIRQKIRL